jgi:hypothetical protein
MPLVLDLDMIYYRENYFFKKKKTKKKINFFSFILFFLKKKENGMVGSSFQATPNGFRGGPESHS